MPLLIKAIKRMLMSSCTGQETFTATENDCCEGGKW